MHDWYLLDRLFISFFIYAVYGMVAWHMRHHFEWFVRRSIVWLFVIFFAILVWTNRELFGFGFPVSLYNATYYKPSMTLYCLVIITLIATYAHRAFLANIFWEQLLWQGLRLQQYAAAHPLWVLVATWSFTWMLSLNSAWLIHHGWLYLKKRLYQLQD